MLPGRAPHAKRHSVPGVFHAEGVVDTGNDGNPRQHHGHFMVYAEVGSRW